MTFASGVTGAAVNVSARVDVRRDLADAQWEPQLVVTLPSLSLGPTGIKAVRPDQAVRDVLIDDSQFTVAPQPIALPAQYGSWHYPNYRAAAVTAWRTSRWT